MGRRSAKPRGERNLGIQHVLVVQHRHAGCLDQPPRRVIGTPAKTLFEAFGTKVLYGVDAVRQQLRLLRYCCLVLFVVGAEAPTRLRRTILLRFVASPRCRQLTAHLVHTFPVAFFADLWVNAHVPSRAQANSEDMACSQASRLRRGTAFRSSSHGVVDCLGLLLPIRCQHTNPEIDHHFELFQSLAHLWHSSCAVDEPPDLGVSPLVGRDEGEQCDRLSGASRHLQDAVAFRIKRTLERTHVAILFWIDAIVGEVDA
mmetsp:Transcript_103615/g.186954  ORF Transcript_103615/g.186954 Transcript_103615/m.186954 type:complete len:258 (-) Transcript_103615:216-989(-)